MSVKKPDMAKATFGAGCFWGVEAAFRKINGIVSTRVGYSGGHTVNPSYDDVCSGMTGHAEVVEVTYDPEKISYDGLLRVFWNIHDPTSLGRQGPDIGSQYRSIIFFYTPEQEQLAIQSKKELDKNGVYKKKIVTEIVPAGPFYAADDYHQRYFEKHS